MTPQDGKVKIHPSSINEKSPSFPSPYLVYYTKQLSSAIYLHDTTSISPMGLIFAGPNSKIGKNKFHEFMTHFSFIFSHCSR